mmetsp:Transcript_81118/g.216700  ORF Transcript_81118/g.216700 Transcript_81118/m.216700 type:complete len:101 (-) Transcript_81118:687-989(-)
MTVRDDRRPGQLPDRDPRERYPEPLPRMPPFCEAPGEKGRQLPGRNPGERYPEPLPRMPPFSEPAGGKGLADDGANSTEGTPKLGMRCGQDIENGDGDVL